MIKIMKNIIMLICIISVVNLFGEEKKDEKVYLRITKSIEKIIKYNKRNIPLKCEEWEIVYLWVSYDKSNFYLFKDNKYVGNHIIRRNPARQSGNILPPNSAVSCRVIRNYPAT
jgi:hypothetical protein